MVADSFLVVWLASLLLHAGAAGFLTGFGWAGCALGSGALALLVGRLKAAGVLSEKTVHRLQMGALIVAICAGFFTLWPRSRGFAEPNARREGGGAGSGKYRGVILWTPPKHQALVAPARPEPGDGKNAKEQNWTIPFDGVYWFFKYPDLKPPAGSYTLSGSPEKISFRSSDTFALEMEARQNFVNPMEMSCCSRIAVEISNADTYPGTILLELTLSNLRAPGEPFQRLGRLPVASAPQKVSEKEVRPAHEVLSFAMPENPQIPQFDSATVRFLRASGRNFSSAKIAIERFTLTPR